MKIAAEEQKSTTLTTDGLRKEKIISPSSRFGTEGEY